LFLELQWPDREEEFAISLELTPQQFGDSRRWLRCCRCGRRSARLYLPPGDTDFVCRECGALTYRSVKTAHQMQRALASVGRMRAKFQSLLDEEAEGG
jgi:hypothetical protein